MQTSKSLLTAGICLLVITAISAGFVELTLPEDAQLLTQTGFEQLQGLEKIKVAMLVSAGDNGPDIRRSVEAEIRNILSAASLEMPLRTSWGTSTGNSEDEYRVYIRVADVNQHCIFHVQSALARQVRVNGSGTETDAEVWRISSGLLVAENAELANEISKAAAEQARGFATVLKKSRQIAPQQAARAPAQAAREKFEPASQQQPQSDSMFVSSKNSKIFHKPDCSSAARISKENLVGYNSRADALAAGKRPCKICKP